MPPLLNRSIVYARTISNALLAAAAANRALTRLSTHRHACNYQRDDGQIIALVTTYHGNGPFHILLPHPLPDSLTGKQGGSGQWQKDKLCFGDLQIDLTQAASWQPHLPMRLTPADATLSLLYELVGQAPSSPLLVGPEPLRQRAQQGITALQSGILHQNDTQIKAGVTCLAGLGPGLTPAGDDFLVGFLAAHHAIRWPDADAQPSLGRLIAQAAAPRTTRLSAQWLHHAGQGHFGETWHHLIDALNRNESAAITATAHRILITGATSGIDAMSGFLFGVSLLQAMVDH